MLVVKRSITLQILGVSWLLTIKEIPKISKMKRKELVFCLKRFQLMVSLMRLLKTSTIKGLPRLES